jgi:YggT family protein
MEYVVQLILVVTRLLSLAVMLYVIAGYFLGQFHPVRRALESVIDPLLAPIRRFLPSSGPLDFSPLVLLFLIFLSERVLIGLIIAVGKP